MITESELKLIFPKLAQHPQRLTDYRPLLDAAMTEAQINTPLRAAAFLAQVGHESDEFRYMGEVWGPTPQQLRYDPPTTLAARLGNTSPGEGYRYRGAGPLQITGKSNFKTYGAHLGLDLVGNPDLARDPAVGFRLAASYWTTHGLNTLADSQDFDAITYRINGGYTGKPQRDAYYSLAKHVLGV